MVGKYLGGVLVVEILVIFDARAASVGQVLPSEDAPPKSATPKF